MKVIFFGTGRFYENKKNSLKAALAVEIIAFIDNNSSLWGSKKDGVIVIAPETVNKMEYDYIVILSDRYHVQMREQLLEIGVAEDKVLDFDSFMETVTKGSMRVFLPLKMEPFTKKILFISTDLKYVGGSLAVLYAALKCKEMGFMPVVVTPDADEQLIEEFRAQGIMFCIAYNVRRESMEQLEWLGEFSCVFVNSFQMRPCVEEFAKKYSVIWWLHEATLYYRENSKLCYQVKDDVLQKVKIYGVTPVAEKNLKQFLPDVKTETLTLGIPDSSHNRNENKTEKLVFATIGRVIEHKGQDLFLKAVMSMPESSNVEFWIIGYSDNEYAKVLKKQADGRKDIKFLGVKTRKEMEELYQQIDVVLVNSREETLSIVAIESMVYEKVCVVSDACGIVDFIEGKEAELVYHSESVEELAERIQWCIENKDELVSIGKEARKTYEKYFAMDVFGEKIKRIVLDASKKC